MTIALPLAVKEASELFQNNLQKDEGHYIFGANRHWHGGMHFSINKPVKAIADGKLIAFRVCADYKTHTYRQNGKLVTKEYSNSFALIQHQFKTPKGAELNYYSLYMHLLPANQILQDKEKGIPLFLRPGKGDPQDATVNTTEDMPGGLNLRSVKNKSILATAPVGAKVTIIENPSDFSTNPDYAGFVEAHNRNNDYKLVSFTSHQGEPVELAYALLDASRAEIQGSEATITTEEDKINDSSLRGLRLRKDGRGGEIKRVIPNKSRIKVVMPEGGGYGEVKEIEGESIDSGLFVYTRNTIQLDARDIDESVLNSVQCPNSNIECEDLIGYPGTNLNERNCLHFEIFADDSIETFIKNPHDEGEKTILKVPSGTVLHDRNKLSIKRLATSLNARTKVEVLETEGATSHCRIKCHGQLALMKRDDLGEYKNNAYEIKADSLASMQQIFGEDISESSKLEFVGYSNAQGEIIAPNKTDDHRMVYFPWPTEKTYWVSVSSLNTEKVGEHDSVISNGITKLYDANPDAFSFSSTKQASTDDAYADLANCTSVKKSDDEQANACFDPDGNKWVQVTLPFDGQGTFTVLANYLNVPRPEAKTGWVKFDDCEAISPYNWPGFHIAGEQGTGSEDAYIDFDNLNPFFKHLLQVIDENNDNIISHDELKKAYQNPVLRDRLNGAIVKHPSEWQADAELKNWQHLEKWFLTKDEHDATKEHISNLVWWDEVKPLSDSSVYHLNPVAAITQIKALNQGLVTLDLLMIAAPKTDKDYLEKILPIINKYIPIYGIKTNNQIAHFLAQIGHESSFKVTSENLNYSVNRMRQIFGCKRPSVNWDEKNNTCDPINRKRDKLWTNPETYANNAIALGNYVYANRDDLENGDEKSGDGYKYRGRGILQLTGKYNYKLYTKIHNNRCPDDQRDFVEDPDLIIHNLEYGIESAFVWWDMNGMQSKTIKSTESTLINVSKLVNGAKDVASINGLSDRKAHFKDILKFITGE